MADFETYERTIKTNTAKEKGGNAGVSGAGRREEGGGQGGETGVGYENEEPSLALQFRSRLRHEHRGKALKEKMNYSPS